MKIRAFVCACVVIVLAVHATAQEWPEIVLEERWSGFFRPVQLTNAGDGSGRLFVVEQIGRVMAIDNGEVLQVPFLDIGDRVSCCGERGLLGMAFPPGFSIKGYFYINYTDQSGDTVVSRVHLSGDPNRADPDSEEVLLTIDQPYSNHNGGQLAFGPDGYLYIGMGDGGSAGDPQDNGQNPLTLLGALLRIDVESGEDPYGIPDSNPFAFDDAHQPEIWAFGLRNPWRFSFDLDTGDLFIADVGQNEWEEVNFQPAASTGGENYGWRIMEGSQCFNPDPCDSSGLVLPVAEYNHATSGCSVTGGHVYRGFRWPRLFGLYLYGDYCSGRIWALRGGPESWETSQLLNTGRSISAFGIDDLGALYVVDYGSGEVLAITDPDVEESFQSVVPAVAHVFGSGGTPWRAELVVTNPNGQPAEVDLVFSAGGMTLEGSATVPAGGGVAWSDVLVDLFGMDGDDQAAGVVKALSEVPVTVSARSYAALADGTFGQYLPGLGSSDGIGAGEFGLVPQLARSEARYTNLGFINLGDQSLELAVTMRDGSGEALGEVMTIALGAGEWKQLFDVLSGLGEHDAASARMEVLTPGGRAWAYASVVDRDSRDPTTVPMSVR